MTQSDRACRIRSRAGALMICVFLLAAPDAMAEETPLGEQNQCDLAAAQAAMDVGVPLHILRAITRIETGRTRNGQMMPWPWTSNLAGTGRWYGSRSEALRDIQRIERTGETRFDVGCFQLNYRWHGDAFTSLGAMLDPVQNAAYAARFLQRLHAEFGDWTAAIGAYHSRTEIHASRYVARYHEVLASLPAIHAPQSPEMPRAQASQPFNDMARPSLWAAHSGEASRAATAIGPLRARAVQPLWATAP